MTTTKCQTCNGCGQVANDKDQTPWTFWAELPAAAYIAVRAGLVRPIPCPSCAADTDRVQCPLCEWSTERAPANDPRAVDGLAAVFGMSGSTLASLHSDQDRQRVEREFNHHLGSHGPEEWLPALMEARHARDAAVDALVKND